MLVGLEPLLERGVLAEKQCQIRLRLLQFGFEVSGRRRQRVSRRMDGADDLLNVNFAFIVLGVKEFVFVQKFIHFALQLFNICNESSSVWCDEQTSIGRCRRATTKLLYLTV